MTWAIAVLMSLGPVDMENHQIQWENPWENHGKMVIYMENHNFQWVSPL